MAAIHFKFERFQDVHIFGRREHGTAGAVFVRPHDDGGAAGLGRRRGQQQPRQLAASALVALLLALRVGGLRRYDAGRWRLPGTLGSCLLQR